MEATMTALKQYGVVATGVGLLSLTLVVTHVGQVTAQQKPLDVTVVNTGAEPVPVVTIPARALHQESHNASFTEKFFNFSIDVPAGQRLIIESASVRVALPAGDRAQANVSGNFTTGVGMQFLSLAFQGTFDGKDIYTTTQPVRLYVGAGGGIFTIVRAGAGSVFAEVSIAGYFETVP
jgi:hypothetical protein